MCYHLKKFLYSIRQQSSPLYDVIHPELASSPERARRHAGARGGAGACKQHDTGRNRAARTRVKGHKTMAKLTAQWFGWEAVPRWPASCYGSDGIGTLLRGS